MPWIHLHVGNHGKVNACCVANINYGNINDQSLEEIWNGEAVQTIREEFAKGEIDKRCHHCIQREAAGAKSIRQETFEKFPNLNVLEDEIKAPIYFDIRFSNVCNFRCRTCYHGASSKWYQDAKQLGTQVTEKAIIKNINDFDTFIQKCGPALLQAQELYFAGGEPLVTEEHYLLLDWLIKNKSTKARLRYNTNFSKLLFKDHDILKYWAQFPQVEILASIDASHELGEYIRKEMSWNTIVENREKIRSLDHITFKLSPTVSVMNVAHLPDLYKEALDLKMINPVELYINLLEFPAYFNIQILPKDVKKQIQKKYEAFFCWLEKEKHPTHLIKSFQDILKYMNQENANSTTNQKQLWKKYKSQTKVLDDLRGEEMPKLISF